MQTQCKLYMYGLGGGGAVLNCENDPKKINAI
jgi:hypothetical protein